MLGDYKSVMMGYNGYIYIYNIVTQFGKTTLVAHNNFEQTLIFKHSLFIQEANEIWYLGGALAAVPGYQISLASGVKWPNSECLKVRLCSKLICATSVVKLGHIYIYIFMY